MAQVQKYTDDQLMDAVIKYAEANPGRIKIATLAKWSARNIPGLEEIRDYHFTKQQVFTDSKTGKRFKRNRPALDKINEINQTRGVTASIKRNLILHSADPDAFLNEPKPIQRNQILEARELAECLSHQNRNYINENKLLKSENTELHVRCDELEQMLIHIQTEQERLEKKLNHFIKVVDKEQCRQALGEIGIQNERFDLDTALIQQKISDAVSINDILQKLNKSLSGKDTGATINPVDGIDVFEGLNL